MKIGIFEDANGKRHALEVEPYKAFKKSQFWLATYKHITYTERADLDDRQQKALVNTTNKIKKIGMFDLVANGWTLQGDVAKTDCQVSKQKAELEKQGKRLKAWERSMKRMDMMPSAAGTILGKMIDF